ncbi:hypothetical protein EJ04DRAFT_529140 [Polyplosphaeria fusca]|uniref:Uncharacterized protein n=1 Tax=Polyplosphaeria fusca TaxID=682080 RepID=A0A9P4QJU2_9PLEO|nr:hypothetical protein EJ04DRAFT_529140 [Polyplosphaeria fusca]
MFAQRVGTETTPERGLDGDECCGWKRVWIQCVLIAHSCNGSWVRSFDISVAAHTVVVDGNVRVIGMSYFPGANSNNIAPAKDLADGITGVAAYHLTDAVLFELASLCLGEHYDAAVRDVLLANSQSEDSHESDDIHGLCGPPSYLVNSTPLLTSNLPSPLRATQARVFYVHTTAHDDLETSKGFGSPSMSVTISSPATVVVNDSSDSVRYTASGHEARCWCAWYSSAAKLSTSTKAMLKGVCAALSASQEVASQEEGTTL